MRGRPGAATDPLAPTFGASFDLLATAPQGVAKLRELILSLAVRGKLLPQDHRDEPAAASLARINVAKDRLVAEGVIKQHKATGSIVGVDQPFNLPINWKWTRLADLVAILNGRAYAKDELLSAGVPVLRVGNLFTSNHWYYSNLTLEPDKYCDVGDLLFAWSASFGPFIWPGPKAIYHYHIWKLNLHSAQDFNKYYLYTFLLKKTQEIKAAGHGVSMLHMTKEKMEKIVVPLPPLAEQARIVARVEELMRLCDALEAHGRLQDKQHARLVATLFDALAASASAHALADNWQRIAAHFDLLLDRPEAVDALEQTLLQLAVRGLLIPQDPADEPASELLARIRAEKYRLVAAGQLKHEKPPPPIEDDEKPFDTPKSWCWARMETLCEAVVDCPHSTARFVESGVLCVDTNSFKSWKFIPHKLRYVTEQTFTERVARLVPQSGDLVFAREGSVGESVLIPEDTRCCLGQRVMLFRFSASALNVYIQMAISSKDFLDRLLVLHKGIGAKHVNVSDMRLSPIPLPPLAEQHRIVARVEQLRRLCAELRERLQQSRVTESRLADALVAQVAA